MTPQQFASVYDKYQQLYNKAVAANLTLGLNQQEYIRFAMSAEMLNYQDVLHAKWNEFEGRQPQIAELQAKLHASEQDFNKLHADTVKQLQSLTQSIEQGGGR